MSFGAARLATEEAVFRPALLLSTLPGITEMQMATKLSYAEQLKHPNWQRKRLEVMERAGFKCEACGDKDTMLNVHHKQYVKGRKAWEYDANELTCFCETCHKEKHEIKDGIAHFMGVMFAPGVAFDEFSFGLLGGFLAPFKLGEEEVVESSLKVARASFELGFCLAMLGPDDLKNALRAKLAAGEIEGHPFIDSMLSD